MHEKVKKSCDRLEQALVLHTEVKLALAEINHSGSADADKLRAKTKILLRKLKAPNEQKAVRGVRT